MKSILFDLDGTLTDSGEGIINCASLALRELGLDVPDRKAMRAFVGPPLRETFQKFGVKPEDTERAVAIYRSRYVPIGMFENTPYPAIHAMLAALKDGGHQLYVATSKPEAMATAILERFHLAQYFHLICGATMDDSRDSKDKVIGYLLQRMDPSHQIIMIGDTTFDVIGAASHGISTIAVAWGYGDPQEMRRHGAIAVAESPAQLLQMLL
ncbi:MAG: HAD hydrolase-like protein [Oscillospiraceae bacterium]|nr:HAD hydrolase-like protein [Oscillospiraceae bacterium]